MEVMQRVCSLKKVLMLCNLRGNGWGCSLKTSACKYGAVLQKIGLDYLNSK